MTASSLLLALELVIAVGISLYAHELAHHLAATRLRYLRSVGHRFEPRRLVDPFGSLLLPGIAIVLVASGAPGLIPVFAYARPGASDGSTMRDARRGPLLVALAGPLANLALAAVAGIAIREGMGGELARGTAAFLWVNATMAVVQILPIPGLDGSRLLVRWLPQRPADVFAGIDPYLPLVILVLFFVLSGPFLGIVRALTSAVCGIAAGPGVC